MLFSFFSEKEKGVEARATHLPKKSRDPIGALQAVIEVLQVAAIESVVSEIDVIVRVQIDMAGLEGLEGMKVDNIKPRGSFRLPCWCAGFKADFRSWVAPLVTLGCC